MGAVGCSVAADARLAVRMCKYNLNTGSVLWDEKGECGMLTSCTYFLLLMALWMT